MPDPLSSLYGSLNWRVPGAIRSLRANHSLRILEHCSGIHSRTEASQVMIAAHG
jgi:hypothetical protein